VDFDTIACELDPNVVRWGRAVIKTTDRWRRADAEALLVDGVVVELARPLHPVALMATRDGDTVIRLWPVVEVERTPAVQRWLAVLAAEVQRLGGGPLVTTNIGPEVLEGLDLELG
jgi:hypothetical protein